MKLKYTLPKKKINTQLNIKANNVRVIMIMSATYSFLPFFFFFIESILSDFLFLPSEKNCWENKFTKYIAENLYDIIEDIIIIIFNYSKPFNCRYDSIMSQLLSFTNLQYFLLTPAKNVEIMTQQFC